LLRATLVCRCWLRWIVKPPPALNALTLHATRRARHPVVKPTLIKVLWDNAPAQD
jgi:hypothetical protein